MVNEKLISKISIINRALGIIEGVMLASDLKVAEALGTAVSMIDETMKEVWEDGE